MNKYVTCAEIKHVYSLKGHMFVLMFFFIFPGTDTKGIV